MPSNYKPVIVTIYRKKQPAKKPASKEVVLEIPVVDREINQVITKEETKPTRGVQIVNLFGDEKI
jgi:hypothetical protein